MKVKKKKKDEKIKCWRDAVIIYKKKSEQIKNLTYQQKKNPCNISSKP